MRRELAHIQRQGHINHGQEIYCVKLASSVSMLDADRVCSSDRGVVSHLSMPPLVLMLSASNLFFPSPFSSFPLHIFAKLKSRLPVTLIHIFLAKTGVWWSLQLPLGSLKGWAEEDPVVCRCWSFLFPPLTSQTTCSTDEKTGKDRLGGKKRETTDCVNKLKFHRLLRGEKMTFFLETLVVINSSMPHHRIRTWRSD